MPRWRINSAEILVDHEHSLKLVPVPVDLDLVTAQDGTVWVGMPLEKLGDAVEAEVYGWD